MHRLPNDVWAKVETDLAATDSLNMVGFPLLTGMRCDGAEACCCGFWIVQEVVIDTPVAEALVQQPPLQF
jgi:hypothetical protein